MLQASFRFSVFLKTEGKELKRRILQKVLRIVGLCTSLTSIRVKSKQDHSQHSHLIVCTYRHEKPPLTSRQFELWYSTSYVK